MTKQIEMKVRQTDSRETNRRYTRGEREKREEFY